MRDIRRHASGRPVRRRIRQKVLSIPRIPPEQPLTPGLRNDRNVEAIGFHHDYITPEPDDWDDDCRKS